LDKNEILWGSMMLRIGGGVICLSLVSLWVSSFWQTYGRAGWVLSERHSTMREKKHKRLHFVSLWVPAFYYSLVVGLKYFV
ncbi:10597_t:CDS:2, partial [Funneliformis caledonium]